MAASKIRDLPVKVSADLVRKCPGFSIDIGGSAVKIVYRSKSDWDAVQDEKTESGTLHFMTCGRPDLDEVLEKVKKEMYLSPSEGKKVQAYSCGVGGYQLNDKLEEALGIEIKNIQEGDCLFAGLNHMLENTSVDELMYPKMEHEEQEVYEEMKEVVELIRKFVEASDSVNVESMDLNLNAMFSSRSIPRDEVKSLKDTLGEDGMFPAMLLQLGSAYGFVKFPADPTKIKPLFVSYRGGRHFMGIASLLTECKSYDEFIDMAEKGDNTKVDQTMLDLKADDAKSNAKEGDVYGEVSNMKNDSVAFHFGHTVFNNKDKFQREDLARAWLLSTVVDICGTAFLFAHYEGIKTIIINGSFANRELVRQLMTREFTRNKINGAINLGPPVGGVQPELIFMKHGGHPGAFGAMIKSVQAQEKQEVEPKNNTPENENKKETETKAIDESEDLTHL